MIETLANKKDQVLGFDRLPQAVRPARVAGPWIKGQSAVRIVGLIAAVDGGGAREDPCGLVLELAFK